MDQTIKCRDCNNDFVFTESEQAFFQKLVQDGKIPQYIPPKRCKNCRQAKKNQGRGQTY
ncbi:MAG: zinc-ribbon domain containing protein [Nitrosarchaeum sp.]|nr:zinc-ribbon domain containing protein [Nitrosarchaeum sp.]